MKIISYLQGKKILQAAAETISDAKDFVSNVAKKEEIQDMGHEFTQAVKAKYFTKKIVNKNGSEVQMTFNAETGKLEQWTRKTADGSVTNARIFYRSPHIKKTVIFDENSVKQKSVLKFGDATEILSKEFDLTNYPEVMIKETEKIFNRGTKNQSGIKDVTIQKQMESCIEKQDYIDLMSI